MNIIVWNCRGALKPNFQSHVRDLVRTHNPSILVVMETRIGGDRAKEIINRLPFDGFIYTNTLGFAGGIWLLWNSDRVEVVSLATTEQEIHAEVKVLPSNLAWIFTAVYASPRIAERRVLWDNLAKVADLHRKPWIIAGDFNEALVGDDKFGGRPVDINRALMFKDCLDKCNMVDMGFNGPRYTWTNRREIHSLIQERIDRFFMNPSWCLLYPDAKVSHLTRCHSDHCPVLMETNPRRQLHLARPFRFQSFWLSDPSFPIVVNKAWQQPRRLMEAIDVFSRQASLWNKNHFGNIFKKKNRILARLDGVQRSLANQPSSSLVALEKSLCKELDVVLEQERDLWALKSRINWMILGDINTSFYHISALARRKRNFITAIKNDAGVWLTKEREVANHFREGFIKIYTTSQVVATRDFSYNVQWQPKLSCDEKISISHMVTEEEIRAALWSLKAFKAPGPDGLHAGFF